MQCWTSSSLEIFLIQTEEEIVYVLCKVINEPWEARRQTESPNKSLLAMATDKIIKLSLFALSSQKLNTAAAQPPQQRLKAEQL